MACPVRRQKKYKLVHRGNVGSVFKWGNMKVVKSAVISALARSYVPSFGPDGASTITGLSKMQQEGRILNKVKGLKNVVQLIRITQGPERLSFVMRWGGDPLMSWHSTHYDRGQSESRGIYSEKEAKLIFKQLLEAVQNVHEKGIAHKDIKPENVLLTENQTVTLIDLSSAEVMIDGRIFDAQGTVHFSPPELFRVSESEHVRSFDGAKRDIWSLGMTLFVMLFGLFPFDATKTGIWLQLTIANIEQIDVPSTVSDHCKRLIQGLLSTDPSKRMTLDEALLSKWLI